VGECGVDAEKLKLDRACSLIYVVQHSNNLLFFYRVLKKERFGHHGLMVRRCFPVAKIVGSSPTGVVSFCFYNMFVAFLLLLHDVMIRGIFVVVEQCC
jgi:hypothetical protein